MKGIITVLALLLTLSTIGQNHIIGTKSGINSTNVSSSNFITNNDSRTGFSSGLTYEFQFKNKFSFGIDFLYFQKGFTNDLIFTDTIGNPTGEKATIQFNYNYLSFPIKGGFVFGEKTSGFVNVGLVPSFLISGEIIEPETEGLFDKKTTDISELASSFDLGGLIEVGGNYTFGESLILFTSFAYQHSFTSLTNSNHFAESSIRHNALTLSLGLKYRLKNN